MVGVGQQCKSRTTLLDLGLNLGLFWTGIFCRGGRKEGRKQEERSIRKKKQGRGKRRRTESKKRGGGKREETSEGKRDPHGITTCNSCHRTRTAQCLLGSPRKGAKKILLHSYDCCPY